MPGTFRDLILQAASSDAALDVLTKALAKISLFKSLIGTTQGIDVIEGGIKINAIEVTNWCLDSLLLLCRFPNWYDTLYIPFILSDINIMLSPFLP